MSSPRYSKASRTPILYKLFANYTIVWESFVAISIIYDSIP